MPCASCGKKLKYEMFTRHYCGFCGVNLCKRCLRIHKAKEQPEIEEAKWFWDRYKEKINARKFKCPKCNNRLIVQFFPALFLVVFVVISMLMTSLVLSVNMVEEEVEWDKTGPTPFPDGGEGNYVKLFGRINSSREIVLEPAWNSTGWVLDDPWNVTDFDLTNRDHTIHVNMSDFEAIIAREKYESYRNGDLVYVVGTIYFENGTRCIHAEAVAYDYDIYWRSIELYHSALRVVVFPSALVLAILCELMAVRWIFPYINRNLDFPKPDVMDDSIRALDRDRISGLEKSNAGIVIRSMIHICWVLFLAFAVIWCAIYFSICTGTDFIFNDTREFLAFLVDFFILSLLNSISLAILFFCHPRMLEKMDVSRKGLYFRFGFDNGEFLAWSDIENAKENTFSITVVTAVYGEISFPFIRKKIRDEIISRIETETYRSADFRDI